MSRIYSINTPYSLHHFYWIPRDIIINNYRYSEWVRSWCWLLRVFIASVSPVSVRERVRDGCSRSKKIAKWGFSLKAAVLSALLGDRFSTGWLALVPGEGCRDADCPVKDTSSVFPHFQHFFVHFERFLPFYSFFFHNCFYSNKV